MANIRHEFPNCGEEIKISSIIKIQALIRGVLVRKWFKELKELYTAVVSDIQRESAVEVVWRGSLSKPKVVKTSHKKKLASQKTVDSPRLGNVDITKTTNVTSTKSSPRVSASEAGEIDDLTPRSQSCSQNTPRCQNVSLNASSSSSRSHKSVNIQTESKANSLDNYAYEKDMKESFLNSVETQTSFIEIRRDEQFSNQNMFHMHDSNRIENKHADLEPVLTSKAKTNKDFVSDQENHFDSENELHFHLDSYRSDFDSETMHKLPDETGRWKSPVDEDTVRKDLDKESVSSEKFFDGKSPRLEKSQQSSVHSATADQKKAINTEMIETESIKDINIVKPSSLSPAPYAKILRRETSPVPRGKKFDKQKLTSQDSSSLTNVTSVWDSVNSVRDSHNLEIPSTLPSDPEQLNSLRKNIAMELLWIQQAINSRKNTEWTFPHYILEDSNFDLSTSGSKNRCNSTLGSIPVLSTGGELDKATVMSS